MKVTEGSTAPIYYVLKDEEGELISSPVSLQYKVTAQSGTVLLDWTAVSAPTSSGVFYVAGAYNVKASVSDNLRYITVKCTYDVSKVKNYEITYEIEDLVGI